MAYYLNSDNLMSHGPGEIKKKGVVITGLGTLSPALSTSGISLTGCCVRNGGRIRTFGENSNMGVSFSRPKRS